MNTFTKRFQNNTFRPAPSGQSLSDRIRAAFSGLGEFLLNLATSDQEPKIRLSHGPDGQAQWSVYDPTSGYRNTFVSENEVRIWLDDRYR